MASSGGIIPVVAFQLSGAGGETESTASIAAIEIRQKSPIRLEVNASKGISWVLRTESGARLLGLEPNVEFSDPSIAEAIWETIENVPRLSIFGLNPGVTTASFEANGATTEIEVVVTP